MGFFMWAPNSWVSWCFSLGRFWGGISVGIRYQISTVGWVRYLFFLILPQIYRNWEAQQYTPLLSRLKHTHKRKIIQYIDVYSFFGPRLPTWTVHGDCKTWSVQIWCLSVGCLGHNGIISLDRHKQNNWMELIYIYIYIHTMPISWGIPLQFSPSSQ